MTKPCAMKIGKYVYHAYYRIGDGDSLHKQFTSPTKLSREEIVQGIYVFLSDYASNLIIESIDEYTLTNTL